MDHVHLVDHPFITDSLAHLRDQSTGLKKFRFHSDQLCKLLFAEAIRGLDFDEVTINTPLKKTKVSKLKDEVVIVPVLRAGLAMLPAALEFLPKSRVGFVGLVRDEETAVASEYYWKLPSIDASSVVIVTDPMLATGGSAAHVLTKIQAESHPKALRLVSVIAAPEGINKIINSFPGVEIFVGAIDSHLNAQKYIVPGLGDYGDRYFGTL